MLKRSILRIKASYLESKVSFEVLCDFSNKSLEWQLTDEKLR